MRNNQNRKQGQKHEETLARRSGLELVPGSGSGMYKHGDLYSKEWHVEAKSTRQATMTFQSKWFSKLHNQAVRACRPKAALCFEYLRRDPEYSGHLEFAALLQEPEGEFLKDLGKKVSDSFSLKQVVFQELSGDKYITLDVEKQGSTYPVYFVTLEHFLREISNGEAE